jgi:hypothetical protein
VIDIPVFSYLVQNELAFKVFDILQTLQFWECVIFLPPIALLGDFTLRFLHRNFWPSPIDILIKENIKIRDDKNMISKISNLKEPRKTYTGMSIKARPIEKEEKESQSSEPDKNKGDVNIELQTYFGDIEKE